MWHDHPFSQRKRKTERTADVGVGGDREVGQGWTKFDKGRAGNIRGLAPLCQLCKGTKNSPSPPL